MDTSNSTTVNPDQFATIVEVISDLKDRVAHIEHIHLRREQTLIAKATGHVPSEEDCPGIWAPCETPSEVAYYASFWHLY